MAANRGLSLTAIRNSLSNPVNPGCPSHTPAPTGYEQWHAWAEKMQRTHKQVRCGRCGTYSIWVLKG